MNSLHHISTGQTTIIIGLISNIILGASVQLQKYAKREMIHLALHGLPPLDFKVLWNSSLSLLLVAECTNLVQYGSSSSRMISPLGEFTLFSNCVLPPLIIDNQGLTVWGSLITMVGILFQILKFDEQGYSEKYAFVFNTESKVLIILEISSCVIAHLLQCRDPGSCLRKLSAGTMLSGMVGAASVALLQLVYTENSTNTSLLITAVLVCWVLEILLLYENLQYFSAWQVLPHHFVLFTLFMYLNTGILFQGFKNDAVSTNILDGLGNLLLFIGVWIAAKPHFDLPVNILESGVLNEISETAKRRLAELTLAENVCELPTENNSTICLDNDRGYMVLREEYRRLLADRLRNHTDSSSSVQLRQV